MCEKPEDIFKFQTLPKSCIVKFPCSPVCSYNKHSLMVLCIQDKDSLRDLVFTAAHHEKTKAAWLYSDSWHHFEMFGTKQTTFFLIRQNVIFSVNNIPNMNLGENGRKLQLPSPHDSSSSSS